MKTKIFTLIVIYFIYSLLAAPQTHGQNGSLCKTIEAHDGPVKSVSFTADGKYIVSAGTDGLIKIRDAKNYNLINRIEFQGFATTSPDGKLIAATGTDKNNKLWLLPECKEIFATGKMIDYRRAIAISPDGKTFAGSSFSEVLLFGIDDGKLKKTINGHDGWIYSICYSPDGKLLATGSTDMTAIIWNIETGRQIKILKGHKAGIHIVKFSPDGKTIATGSADGMIKLWNAETGKEIISIQKNKNIIKTIAFSPCGRFLLSSGTDKTIKVWQSVNGCEICSRPAGDAIINEISLSPDGKFLAACGEDKYIRIYEFEKLIKE